MGTGKSTYSSRLLDLTSQRFGRLTVVKLQGRHSNGRPRWLCRCDCGKETYSTSSQLKGNQKSCGCLQHRRGKDNPRWLGVGDISGKRWCIVKKSAKIRRIEFEISCKYAWSLYEQQHGKCVLSGQVISFDDATASLDRIDSSLGYICGNVQWVHKVVNRMKGNLDEDKFIEWCKIITDWNGEIVDGSLVPITKKYHKWSGAGNLATWMLGRIRTNAKRRNISYDETLTCKELWSLFVRQGGCCALSGVRLQFPPNAYRRVEGTVSLDRIDVSLGYFFNNVRWVHKELNNMRGQLNDELFCLMCEHIVATRS